jgi:hypothetical protein
LILIAKEEMHALLAVEEAKAAGLQEAERSRRGTGAHRPLQILQGLLIIIRQGLPKPSM